MKSRLINIRLIAYLLCISLPAIHCAQSASSNTLVWETDMMKAYERSKKQKKPIFALFTGSDWCIWCKKLQADVFAKKDFVEWANKKVILLEVDFPRYKQLPPELAQQNNGLLQTFQVPGYPTVWLFNMKPSEQNNNFNIEPMGSLGYPAGAEAGKEEVKFLNEANALFKM
jgi:thioredoxin-related protein